MIKYRYTHICDICGRALSEDVYSFFENGGMQKPTLFPGWTRIFEQDICVEHSVLIIVDGKAETVHIRQSPTVNMGLGDLRE